jgi:hypothetical protein
MTESKPFTERAEQARNPVPQSTDPPAVKRPGLSPRRNASQPRESDTGKFRPRQGGLKRPSA